MESSNRESVSQRLYFEDLHIGQRFISGTYHVAESQIKAFAEEFDPQPFHLDDEAAKGTIFRGLAASGWHTAAITMRLMVGGGLPLAGGMIGSSAEISWPKPLRPNSLLHVESEIVDLTQSRSKADRGIAKIRSETRTQLGETVQTLTATLIVVRKPKQEERIDG